MQPRPRADTEGPFFPSLLVCIKFSVVLVPLMGCAERGGGYRRRYRARVNARNTRCTAPGCCRPAARCDLDHTQPWHNGGVTCECNLAPLCRHHHKCKQSDGWALEQPSPGILRWRTPAGRHYVSQPLADMCFCGQAIDLCQALVHPDVATVDCLHSGHFQSNALR